MFLDITGPFEMAVCCAKPPYATGPFEMAVCCAKPPYAASPARLPVGCYDIQMNSVARLFNRLWK
jgi:hypothetical protein